jgi:hypothetical protein
MLALQWLRNYALQGDDAPQLKPALELAAEDGATQWVLFANGKKLGDAVSQVAKTRNGYYQLKQDVNLNGDLETYLGSIISGAAKMVNINVRDLNIAFGTEMEMTYLGTLRKLRLSFTARPKPKITLASSPTHEAPLADSSVLDEARADLLRLIIEGEEKKGDNDYLTFKGSIALANMKIPIDGYKIKHRNKDTLLSTMSPTDCLPGLRLGQRWQTAVLDPTEMLTNSLAHSKTQELTNGAIDTDDFVKKKVTEVHVLDELKVMEWGGAKVLCFVVQSQDRGSKMQAWVNAGNGRVLRQLVEWPDHSIELVRVPKKEE